MQTIYGVSFTQRLNTRQWGVVLFKDHTEAFKFAQTKVDEHCLGVVYFKIVVDPAADVCLTLFTQGMSLVHAPSKRLTERFKRAGRTAYEFRGPPAS